MDLIKDCMTKEAIIYSFVVQDRLVRKFTDAAKEKGQSESKILEKCMIEWLDANCKNDQRGKLRR